MYYKVIARLYPIIVLQVTKTVNETFSVRTEEAYISKVRVAKQCLASIERVGGGSIPEEKFKRRIMAQLPT